ncbi:Uncharacterised protein [Vibrio cholerae]|nr:Uncharacterised protein [Vibrio cholerae]CSI62777.1 Uncharacterised protein [Vibrio cholerae]
MRCLERSAYFTAAIATVLAMLAFSSADNSGFFDSIRALARSCASSSKSAKRTVPPARVLNGRPSLPSIMPNAWCSKLTFSGI